MSELIISIGKTASPPVPKKKAEDVYDKAVQTFASDKNDVGVDRMKAILKLMASLVEIKENDTGEINEDFDEQTNPPSKGRRMFE